MSLWRLHESLARVYEEMRRDGVSGEQEVGAAGGVKRRDSRGVGCQGIVCERSRKRSVCKECAGGSICQHRRERSKCRECLERYCVCAIFWLLYGAGT